MKNHNITRIENSFINRSSNKISHTIKPVKTFSEVLNAQNELSIHFSKHAADRIEDREMCFSTEEIVRLKKALQRAEQKGVRDALILIDDKAVIANVKSRTVITTFKEIQMKENVVTNIDGAVIG